MKQIVTTITQRGQVTVPAEVRRLLGVRPKDKLIFAIDNDQVRVLPAVFSLESSFGSVKPRGRVRSLEEQSQIAKDEHAEEVLRKMRAK